MGWGSAANFKSEIVAQMLVEKLGPAKAAEIFPININPDDESGTALVSGNSNFQRARLNLKFDNMLLSLIALDKSGCI